MLLSLHDMPVNNSRPSIYLILLLSTWTLPVPVQMPQDWYATSIPTIATSPLVNLNLAGNSFAVRLQQS